MCSFFEVRQLSFLKNTPERQTQKADSSNENLHKNHPEVSQQFIGNLHDK
jgi:hypothetical protein